MDTDTRPIVGLMLGDVTGIGAEIASKMLATEDVKARARMVLVGDARHVELGCRDAGTEVAFHGVSSVEAIDWSRSGYPLLDLGNLDPERFRRGEVSPEAGRVAGETLKAMTDLALAGKLDAVCFAPLNKAALHRGGWNYHDEHQMFADWTRHSGYYSEMNVIPEFSTFRVTSHVSLRKALDLVTPERVEAAIRLADRTMRSTGLQAPRIGVAALNPHGVENGLFGDEETRIIRPAVERVRASGVDCAGPLPSDTIFLRALWALRRRRHDVPRPRADRDQAARLSEGRHGQRGNENRLCHPGARHRVRHRRQGPRRPGRHDGGLRHGGEARRREDERRKPARISLSYPSAGR